MQPSTEKYIKDTQSILVCPCEYLDTPLSKDTPSYFRVLSVQEGCSSRGQCTSGWGPSGAAGISPPAGRCGSPPQEAHPGGLAQPCSRPKLAIAARLEPPGCGECGPGSRTAGEMRCHPHSPAGGTTAHTWIIDLVRRGARLIPGTPVELLISPRPSGGDTAHPDANTDQVGAIRAPSRPKRGHAQGPLRPRRHHRRRPVDRGGYLRVGNHACSVATAHR